MNVLGDIVLTALSQASCGAAGVVSLAGYCRGWVGTGSGQAGMGKVNM